MGTAIYTSDCPLFCNVTHGLKYLVEGKNMNPGEYEVGGRRGKGGKWERKEQEEGVLRMHEAFAKC